MTLVEAAAVFFPQGPLTLSSLRRAAATGTLEIAKVAGKDLTTPRAIRKLVKPYAGPQAKPPRLWFREDDETWIILDRGRQIRTGCSRNDIDGAAKALESYICGRHTTTIGATDPSILAIADVLTAYEISRRPKDKNDERVWAQHDLPLIRLLDLNNFFGDKNGR